MPTSGPSNNIVVSTGPKPAPEPPSLSSVGIVQLRAQVVVVMPTKDVAGNVLTENLTDILIFFGPAISGDPTNGVPVQFPGAYPPNSTQSVFIDLPNWGTGYSFIAEVGN